MKAVAQLAVLLCLSWASGAQRDSGRLQHNDIITAPESRLADIWAELKELRDMVVELRVEQSATRSELQSQRIMVDDLRIQKALLETRLGASESRVENLDKVLRQKVELSVTTTELKNHKVTVENLNKENAVLWSKLGETESQVQAQDRETSTLKTRLAAIETVNAEQAIAMTSLGGRLSSSESRVEVLERENADRPNVAFFATLQNTLGPVKSLTTVVHNNVITNIGKAYSPVTGAFTAPVRGVYYFTASGMDDRYERNLHLDFYKIAHYIMSRRKHNNGGNQFVSCDLILELEAGDVVDTRVSDSHRLVGNHVHHVQWLPALPSDIKPYNNVTTV